VYSINLYSDGTLNHYKARLVALGNRQEYGMDYEETFAPFTKITTVRTIIVIAASQGWPLHQMDIKNVFLHGDLKEDIYMVPPPNLVSSSSMVVCKLKWSLYGLKQAPRAWFDKFRTTLLRFSFAQSNYDSSLFICTTSTGCVLLLVYVDDIVITGTDSLLIGQLQQHLRDCFHIKDLGSLTYFLGLEVHSSSSGIYVHQQKYAQDLIALAGLQVSSPLDTLLEVNVKVRRDKGDLLSNPTSYQQLVAVWIILLLLGLIYPLLFSTSVHLCNLHVIYIWSRFVALFDTSLVLPTVAYSTRLGLLFALLHLVMVIRLLILVVPSPVGVCFLVNLWSLGRARNKIAFPNPRLSLHIGPCPLLA
jgi:hypothetical protein